MLRIRTLLDVLYIFLSVLACLDKKVKRAPIVLLVILYLARCPVMIYHLSLSRYKSKHNTYTLYNDGIKTIISHCLTLLYIIYLSPNITSFNYD